MPLDWLRSLVDDRIVSLAPAEVNERIALRLMDADARFNRCLPLVLKHEGGFVDHPRDPGGATNLGISLRYARTRGSMFDLDGDGDVDKDDILRITPEFAGMVYRDWFWDDVRGDDLRAGIDYCMFDFAVNSGAGRAIRYAQAVVGARVDGFIGPQTLRALSEVNVNTFIAQYNERRLLFLRGLSTWPTFGGGWARRVREVRNEATNMAWTPNGAA